MRRYVLAVLLLAAAPAFAQAPLMLDPNALPLIWPAGRDIYANRFLLGNLPRAFALSENGEYGGSWGGGSDEQVSADAIKYCTERGGKNCQIYALDLNVVWHGRPKPDRPKPPAHLLAGQGWSFVPDDRYFWQGPATAKGVVVYAHAYSGATKVALGEAQPQSYLRAFNNAGFDVVRFSRTWDADANTDDMTKHLREGLIDLRKRGWKTVIVAGQSRGAWNALQVLDTPGIADTVIAISPVVNIVEASGKVLEGNPGFWPKFSDTHAPGTRLAFVQFRDDPSYHNGDERVAFIRRLQPKLGALLVIDRPEGITGHGGADNAAFAERYGACLLRFATAPMPPAAC